MSNQIIASARVDTTVTKRRIERLLEGEIPGASVFYHTIPEQDRIEVPGHSNILRVYVLMDGCATFSTEGDHYHISGCTIFVPRPCSPLIVQPDALLHILEIQWELTEQDRELVRQTENTYPLVQNLATSEQYKDGFKSEKAIGRSIIDHHTLPRFAMGANESYGPDIAKEHAHPLLDQFFFSLPDNDVTLLIDGDRFQYGGNTLLHVPLGSNHGVLIEENKKMNYIWIDFLIDPNAYAYLDRVHQFGVEKKSFDENHQLI